MGRGDSVSEEPSGRWAFVVAVVGAVCAVLLALSTNVAASLVPEEWARRHGAWVWAAVVVLAALSVLLAGVGRRRGPGRGDEGAEVGVERGPAHVEIVGEAGRVDRSVRAEGPVVFAEAGASVSIGSLEPSRVLEQRRGQIVVGELPGAPPAFVARGAVEGVAAVFEGDGRVAAVSALTGGRGAGKTQVAAECARQAVGNGVELVAWVAADDGGLLLSGLAEVARQLGVADPEGDSEASAGRLRDALAARRAPALLVLDNARDPQLVRRYLPGAGAARVIITSTDRAFASVGVEVDVGAFSRPESLGYLQARTGLEDKSGAAAVAEELGDLPLALAHAATVINLRSLSYPVYLDRLRSLPLDEILPADRGGAYPRSVARAIVLSVEGVRDRDPSGLTGRVLEAVALLASEGVSRTVVFGVVGESASASGGCDDTLAQLVENSLLVWTQDGATVVMHRLVARAIRDQLEASGHLGMAISATEGGLRGLLVPEDNAWTHRDFGLELVGHAVSVWQSALRAADRGVLSGNEFQGQAGLAQWTVRHLRATADLSRAIQIGTSALDGFQRVLGEDHPDTLGSRNNLAGAYQSAGRLEEAIPIYQETLAARERVLGEDHPDTLSSRNNLAGAYQLAGRLEEAIPIHQEALAASERVLGEDHPNTLTFRANLNRARARRER